MTDSTITAEDVLNRLAELKLSIDSTGPYRLEKMFPKLEGWGSKGDIKAKVALIKQIRSTLDEALLPNEEVLYVSKGVQHSAIEALTIGALWSNMINQTVFVLTNLRLLMFRSNSKGKPAETCWAIFYSQISKFKAKFTGVVDLKLKDGRHLCFSGFSKTDKKTMPAVFEECVETYQNRDFDPDCSQSREDLCGRCFTVVPKGEFACSNCETKFWTPGQVALHSLIFPAWGDFLLKHYPLAIVEVLGAAFTWILAVTFVMNDSEYLGAAFIILFAHSIDAIITYFIARKGLHPV